MLHRKNRIFIFFLIGFLYGLGWVNNTAAISEKDIYFEAENAYQKLLNDPKKKALRENWLQCINRFKAVYDADPKGPWAAAGLFNTGKLYWELSRVSYLDADKREAEVHLKKIAGEFPRSKYRKRAEEFMANNGMNQPNQTPEIAPKKEVTRGAAEESFKEAQSCYRDLLSLPVPQKQRDRWMICLEKFRSSHDADPKGPRAAAGLYMTGFMYEGLSEYAYSEKDRNQALDIYRQVLKDYPQSQYKENAEKKIADLTSRPYKPTPPETRKSEPAQSSRNKAPQGTSESEAGNKPLKPARKSETPENGKSAVTGIRYWSNPNYTRVVVDAQGPLKFSTPYLLDENPTLNKPRRLYFDIQDSLPGKALQKFIPIDDNLLSAVRVAQNTKDSVRVVIDIKSFKNYKIFPLYEPSRIVVDVWGAGGETPPRKQLPVPKDSNEKIAPGALAKQLALGVRRVVIDAGHGGKDPGALGYLKNVQEKDIVLDVAVLLGKKIERELGCEVFFTRRNDRNISLEERTAFANTKNADLFISIHANAHKNKDIHGLETFYLNLATDDESIRVAARENATSEKNISDLHSILSDLMQNAKINESSRLAAYVQSSLYEGLKTKYSHIKDNGVKKAPFYVLLGAQMPAILIETSFISNETECKRLKNKKYQDHLCDAIVSGIRQYIKETSPNTLSRK